MELEIHTSLDKKQFCVSGPVEFDELIRLGPLLPHTAAELDVAPALTVRTEDSAQNQDVYPTCPLHGSSKSHWGID